MAAMLWNSKGCPIVYYLCFFFAVSLCLSGSDNQPSRSSDEIGFADYLHSRDLIGEAFDEYTILSGDEMDRSRYMMGICALELGRMSEFTEIMKTLVNSSGDPYIRDDAILARIYQELRDGNIENAGRIVEKYFESGRIADLNSVIYAYNGEWGKAEVEIPKSRSTALAEVMSIMLPGSGQIYSGHIGNGIRSAALNTAIWYLVIGGFLEGYYARALTVFYIFGSRYWIGGAKRAGKFTEDFNLTERQRAVSYTHLRAHET